MNTLLSRTNAIFAFTLSVLAALTAICSVSTAFKNYSDLVDIKMTANKKLVKNVADYSAGRERNDLGFITFDLEADFGPAFDWNTKQLFLYLTAHYHTKNNVVNQVVLWDKILRRFQVHFLFVSSLLVFMPKISNFFTFIIFFRMPKSL